MPMDNTNFGIHPIFLVIIFVVPVVTWLVNIAISTAMGLITKAGDISLLIGTVAGTAGTALPLALIVWLVEAIDPELGWRWIIAIWGSTFVLSPALSLAMMLETKKLLAVWKSRKFNRAENKAPAP